MAPQTTTTKLDTSQGQGTRPADAPESSSHGENADGNFKGTGQTQANASLPEPNDKLSAGQVNEQEFNIDFVAEEDEKVFNKAFLNEDHVLKEYWKLLKQILETPCENRAKAYES